MYHLLGYGLLPGGPVLSVSVFLVVEVLRLRQLAVQRGEAAPNVHVVIFIHFRRIDAASDLHVEDVILLVRSLDLNVVGDVQVRRTEWLPWRLLPLLFYLKDFHVLPSNE